MKKIILIFFLLLGLNPLLVLAEDISIEDGNCKEVIKTPANCTEIIELYSIEPSSGPVGTKVTITASKLSSKNIVHITTDNYGVGDTGFGKQGADTYRYVSFEVNSTDAKTVTFNIPATMPDFYQDAQGNEKVRTIPILPALYKISVWAPREPDDGFPAAIPLELLNFRVTSSGVKKENKKTESANNVSVNKTQNNIVGSKIEIKENSVDKDKNIIKNETLTRSNNTTTEVPKKSFSEKLKSFFQKLKFW